MPRDLPSNSRTIYCNLAGSVSENTKNIFVHLQLVKHVLELRRTELGPAPDRRLGRRFSGLEKTGIHHKTYSLGWAAGELRRSPASSIAADSSHATIGCDYDSGTSGVE